MVMTTSISTRVKPCWPTSCRRLRVCVSGEENCQRVLRDFIMIQSLLYPTSCVTDSSAVMTDTISPPTTVLMVMMASGPTMPTMRSRLRCNFAS